MLAYLRWVSIPFRVFHVAVRPSTDVLLNQIVFSKTRSDDVWNLAGVTSVALDAVTLSQIGWLRR